MLTHAQRWWTLGGVSVFSKAVEFKGRKEFGFLSPSRRACEAGFNVSEKMKYILSIAL